MQKHEHLPRLADGFYQAYAMVHWTLTIEGRRTGWLNDLFHARFREILLHAAGRYALFCPVYCLMPDHLHMMWMGVKEASDQQNAMKHFKRYVHSIMAPFEFQKQSYDNVLRKKDRAHDAFQATCHYILENPVRAELVGVASEWHFSGAVVPGYPDVSPHKDGYWDLFWRLYAAKRDSLRSRVRQNVEDWPLGETATL